MQMIWDLDTLMCITGVCADKCVLDSCRSLQSRGYEVTYLPVKSDGLIDMAELEAAMRPETSLVSIMAVNNEIGPCSGGSPNMKQELLGRRTMFLMLEHALYARCHVCCEALMAVLFCMPRFSFCIGWMLASLPQQSVQAEAGELRYN